MAASEFDTSTQPKIWECGDPYQYPIPENGDHWENILGPLMERDKAQCESWKDEVQNLLIFAGLFSGVLTAFVIQSYQGLQPDPNDTVITLLKHIATSLDNPLNGSTSTPQSFDTLISPSSPDAASMRVNIFWFVSLVLSLTTVLVGIISLQWLREHQQYPKSLTSKRRFALFNMRARGLEAWYVPQIFSCLPVLLQFALLLFLVGLVDFLLASNIKVAIPVIISIGIPLGFLVWTTAMPTLQAFMLCLPLAGRATEVPNQCPYKSTQSRIFRLLFTSSRRAFLLIAYSTLALHSLAIVLPLHLVRSFKKGVPSSKQQNLSSDEFDREWISKAVLKSWNQKNWLYFDVEWLTLRDTYAKGIADGAWWMSESTRIRCRQVGPLYDLTAGFSYITRLYSEPTVWFSGYHCVQDLTSSVIGDNARILLDDDRRNHNQYLQSLLSGGDLDQSFSTFSQIFSEPSVAFLQDENSFIFLSRYEDPLPIILQHFAELHVRIFNYLYPKTPRTEILDLANIPPCYPEDQWILTYGKDSSRAAKYGSAFDHHISTQFSLAIESFFKAVTDPNLDDARLITSVHAQKFRELLRYAALRQSEDTIQSTLDFLAANLNEYTDGKFGKRSDFLFYACSFYVRSLLILDPVSFILGDSEWDRSPVIGNFLPVLRHYMQKRGTPDLALAERLGIPVLLDEWWGFFKFRGEEDQNCSQDTSPTRSLQQLLSKTVQEQNPVPTTSSNAGDLV